MKTKLIILVIVALLLGYLGYTSLHNPTKDWKTYTDVEHGFEFQYPTNWSAGPGYEGISDVSVSGPGADLPSIGISYFENPADRPVAGPQGLHIDGDKYFYYIGYAIRYDQTLAQLEQIIQTFKLIR